MSLNASWRERVASMADGQVAGCSVEQVAKKVPAYAPLPLSIVRSALFSISANGPWSKHRVIATAKKGVNATITYTGPHLNMEHFRLWQSLLFIADERGQLGGDEFEVSLSDVLLHMGKNYKDKELKDKIANVLTELQSAVITVISDRVDFKNEKLMDAGDLNLDARVLTVKFGERIATRLLDREILRNDMRRSRELKRHYLAIWLHGYISSQASRSDKKATKHTFSVDELRMLCGTQVKERWHFCQELDRALTRLKEGDNPLVADWDWVDRKSKAKVWVKKNHTLVKLLGETKAVAFDKRQHAAVLAAQKARARPVL